ncbi:hypothetical protein PLESTF_000608500 [Pleodorina starrii]|nr:hypothetical protein PLESTM_000665200 [Pleodorina starrii]GLC67798.1 hypothetical protein PLESTF_000608500 [Pleodorina starrii]
MADAANLRAWLQYLRIDKYFDTLSAVGHDAQSLAQLNDAELAALGLPLGPRKKILLNAGLILQSCRSAARSSAAHDERLGGGGGAPDAREAATAALASDLPAPGSSVPSRSNASPENPHRLQQQQQRLTTPSGAGVHAHPHPPQKVLQPRPQPQAHLPRPLQQQPQPDPLQLKSGPLTGAFSASHAPRGNVGQEAVPLPQRPEPPPLARPQRPSRPLTDSSPSHHHQYQRHHQEQQPPPQQQQQQPVAGTRGPSDPWVGAAPGAGGGAAGNLQNPSPAFAACNQKPAQQQQQQQQQLQNPSCAAGGRCAPGDGEARSRASSPLPVDLPKPGPHGILPAIAPAAPSNPVPPGPAAAAPRTAAAGTAESTKAIWLTLTSAAAAERRALAQLYPYPHRLQHPPHCPGAAGAGDYQALGDAAAAPAPCRGVNSGGERGEAAAGALSVGALGSGLRRGVLKRSRSWDGGADAGNRPCPEAAGEPSRRPAQWHQSAAGAGGRRQLASWADGQALYSAAASRQPVDCSFRPLRRAAAAATAAAAAGADAGSTGDAAAARASGARDVREVGGAAAQAVRPLPVQAPSAGGEGDYGPEGGRRLGSDGVDVATQRYHSGAAGASADRAGGGNSSSTRDRDDTERTAAQPRPTAAAAAAAAATAAAVGDGSCSSLLDDPRNYETPELLAQLLYDGDAPDAPGLGDGDGGFGAGGGERHPGGAAQSRGAGVGAAQPPGSGVPGDGGGRAGGAAARVEDGSGHGAGDGGGGGGERVPREQRLARLRALREEVAATERLLATLRRMAADEEAALAADTAAGGGGGGVGAGAPASRAAARQPPPPPPRSGTRPDAHPSASAHQCFQDHPRQALTAPQQQQQQQQIRGRVEPFGQVQVHGAVSAWESRGGSEEAAAAGAGAGPLREATRGPSRELSPELDELPTQRWDSGMMLVERLDLLGE